MGGRGGKPNRNFLSRLLAATSLIKVTPTLFRCRYDIELEEPAHRWELRMHWTAGVVQ
jgi:hypothetical protein